MADVQPPGDAGVDASSDGQPSGVLDESFGAGGTSMLDLPTSGPDRVFDDLVALPNGAFVLQGSFSDTSSATAGGLIKVDGDGAFDVTFGDGGIARYQLAGFEAGTGCEVAADRQGRYLLTGIVTQQGTNNSSSYLARFDGAGKLDATFGDGGVVSWDFAPGRVDLSCSVDEAPDGAILLTGFAQSGETDVYARRFLADGNPDPGFSNAGSFTYDLGGIAERVWDHVTAPDGTAYVAASAVPTDSRRPFVLALRPDGTFETTFGDAGIVELPLAGVDLNRIAIQPGKRLVVVGVFEDASPRKNVVFGLTFAGQLDSTFGSAGIVHVDVGGDDQLFTIVPDASGRLLLAGKSLQGAGPDPDAVVARLLQDGTLDQGFGANGYTLLRPRDASGVPLEGHISLYNVGLDSEQRIVAGGILGSTASSRVFAFRLTP